MVTFIFGLNIISDMDTDRNSLINFIISFLGRLKWVYLGIALICLPIHTTITVVYANLAGIILIIEYLNEKRNKKQKK
jgi:hypothetical protein